MAIGQALRKGLEALSLVPSAKSQQLADSLVKESETERLKNRRRLADERAALVAEHRAVAETYREQHDVAVAGVVRKQAELDEAVAAERDVRRAEMGASLRFDTQRNRLDSELRTSASPLIAACVDELRTLLLTAYSKDKRRVIMERQRHGFGVAVPLWNNHESLRRRAEAIRAAIPVVDALAYEALDDVELEARLEAIRTGLPSVDAVSRDERFVDDDEDGAA